LTRSDGRFIFNSLSCVERIGAKTVMADVMKVIFYPRYTRVNERNTVPLYMRVTINTKRFEVATGRTVKPEEWSKLTDGVNSKSREGKAYQ
jgi:hypothetical protein